MSSSDECPVFRLEGNFLILVVGDRGCGKTSFIRAFYDYNSSEDTYSCNGAQVYPCKVMFRDRLLNIAFLEFPGDSEISLEDKKNHFEAADSIVFMYAIDDFDSFEVVVDDWLDEVLETVEPDNIDLVFVGNKIDLRNDQQLIERHALNNQMLLTKQEVSNQFKDYHINEFLTFLECSNKDVPSVKLTISEIIRKIDFQDEEDITKTWSFNFNN